MSIKNIINFFLVKYDDNKNVKREIADEIKATIIEMEVAEAMFNTVNDPKLIESAIYRDKAARKKFDYLISIAKKQYINDDYLQDEDIDEQVKMEI